MLKIFNLKKKLNEFTYRKKILSNKECDFISNFILNNEENIKSLGPDIYPKTRENSLTGRYSVFNFLNVPEINNILYPKLKKIFNNLKLNYPLYVQCWANTYRKGDYIQPHCHSSKRTNILSGNIFLKGIPFPGTKYFFKEGTTQVKNKIGEISIFKGNLVHSVDPYMGDDIRITMAMDIHFEIEKYYSNMECLYEFELNKKRYYKFEM